MTGREGGAALVPIEPSPVVILVRPQLADNIGSTARCMANGGLFHLRLAIRVLTARAAAAEIHEIQARNAEGGVLRVGILFGPERAGLDGEDLARADTLVRYPLNPEFDSLNLAQAVMVMAYEWWTAAETTPPVQFQTHGTRVAAKGDLDQFLVHLVDQLDACGFLRNAPKRPGMVRNIRHLFERGEITEQELRTLHGVVAGLALGRRRLGRFEDDLPSPGL